MKIAAIVVFLLEAFLSHQGGKQSGEESRWLSKVSGINEGFLRKSAHVLSFLIITVLAVSGFGTAGLIAAAIWALVDELTKPLLKNQRHCSGRDILLNLVGVAAGGTVVLIH